MEHFVEQILRIYFGSNLELAEIAPYVSAAKKQGLADVSTAGGWIHFPELLPKLIILPTSERIWTGLVAKVGGCQVLDILAYTNAQKVTDLELAAPLDDFPSDFADFKFIHFPQFGKGDT